MRFEKEKEKERQKVRKRNKPKERSRIRDDAQGFTLSGYCDATGKNMRSDGVRRPRYCGFEAGY